MDDLTYACACVVMFCCLYMSLFSRNLKEEIDEDCFVSSDKLFQWKARNYSISLCVHGEFVCHQRSIGYI